MPFLGDEHIGMYSKRNLDRMKNGYLILLALLAILMVYGLSNTAVSSDKDFDKVPDHADHCPNTPLLRKADPDSKYAVLHSAEELSVEPRSVPVDAQGCALDSDRDGVADYKDYCPDNSAEELAAGVHKNGCPLQSDGDGTPDYRDRCPDTAQGVRADNNGCPIL